MYIADWEVLKTDNDTVRKVNLFKSAFATAWYLIKQFRQPTEQEYASCHLTGLLYGSFCFPPIEMCPRVRITKILRHEWQHGIKYPRVLCRQHIE